jgi:hypothetical protein
VAEANPEDGLRAVAAGISELCIMMTYLSVLRPFNKWQRVEKKRR